MFEPLDRLDAPGALAAAAECRRAADAAEARLLALAAHWADLHAERDGEGARLDVPGMERLCRLAGEGTPEVAEFAPAELGAALGLTTFAASCLIGDALELRHRLPRLWARVADGTVQAWRARRVADHTKILSPDAAAWVDAQVAPFAHKVGTRRLADLVAAALLRFDPDEALRRLEAGRERRGVRVGEGIVDGNRSVAIEADAMDVALFDATLDAIADALAALGDTDAADLRRARAVGVIADPQGTLDLLAAAAGDRPGDPGSADEAPATQPGARPAPGSTAGPVRRRTGGPRTRPMLHVHVHADSIAAHGAGALARVEGLGPTVLAQVQEWIGATDVTVTPVVDLADSRPVDCYEAPARTREAVLLRSPCCPFPWCSNLSRNKDLDHVEPFRPPDEGGPPGQTRADNLAPLCRRHHRLKTHGGWRYTMVEPGTFVWRSPLGRRYLVDHTGTSVLPPARDTMPARLPETA